MNALLRLLPEFEVPAVSRPVPPAWRVLDWPAPGDAMPAPEEDLAFPAPLALEEPEIAPEPEPDRVDEAVAAALAEAEARHAEALAALEAQALAERAEARAAWAATEGGALGRALAGALAQLEDRLATSAAEVLEPLVGEAVRRLAIDELRRTLAELVSGGTGARITISGPEDLLEGLRQGLPGAEGEGSPFAFVPGGGPEVTVAADTSLVRSRLGAWGEALSRRLALTGNADA